MLRTLTQPLLEGEETCASPRSSLLLTSPPLTQSQCIGTPPLPEQIELHRDRMWRRDEDLRVERDVDAERFIEDVGFGVRPIFRLFDTIAAQECGTTMTERGKIHSGSIVLDEPIDLPEGTEVVVHVEPVVHEHASAGNGNEFENLPFFRMWADRDEMSDSVAWVRKERDKWQQRLTQQR